MTDLAQFIRETPLVDTHEHTFSESEYVENGPDVLQHLFHTYIATDLTAAGASPAAVERLFDTRDPDIAGRWNGVKDAWEFCQHTSYGQAARLIARLVYGMDTITLDAIQAAAPLNAEFRQPGGRLRLMRDMANLDHVQINHHMWACLPDASGPDFFLYDLRWVDFSCGTIDFPALRTETGIEVTDTASLREAMAALFARYGDCAIAIKTQHAYDRTLAWRERSDDEAAPALHKALRGTALSGADLVCLGDWGLARGVELAIEHNLPVKIHTGYMAFNNTMIEPDRLRSGYLAPLFARYPAARFVLMHLAYPYTEELIAVAKNFPNVYVDMCWGWAMNFRTAVEFVRRMIHAVPVNKLFAFGGDTFWPAQTVAYAAQARDGLTRALHAEIADGTITETEAIRMAARVMRDNQYACFDITGRRATIQARLGGISAG